MNNKIKILKKIILIFFIGFMGFVGSSQSKIKDNSIPKSTFIPKKGAILELESINKGFLTPRITTSQRDKIVNITDGLLIFNITTGCFNYYKEKENSWLSLCGTPPPALFEITCNAINENGIYTKEEILTANNYLTVPVTVSQPGNYFISGTTTNGFYFEKDGFFPATGNYMVNIPGIGMPNNNEKTPITFSLNGVTNNKCNHTISVGSSGEESTNAVFTMDCDAKNFTKKGSYLKGVSLTSDNIISININVTTPGYWNIKSNTINGYSFSGSGNFKSIGRQKVELTASGKPSESGTNVFTLNSKNTISSCTELSIEIPKTKFEIIGSGNFQGTYRQHTALNDFNKVTLPVNVIATGDYDIITSVNGMKFKVKGTFIKPGNQDIILTGSGTPTVPGINEFNQITNDDLTISMNGYDLKVEVAAVAVRYEIDCNSVKITGVYRKGVSLTKDNTITMTLIASAMEPYSITTTANGMTFTASGKTKEGNNYITLTGSGAPETFAKTTFSITNDNDPSQKPCIVSTVIAYRKMNVLGLGSHGFKIYQPGAADSKASAKAVLASTKNFGIKPNSTIKVEGVNIFNGESPTKATDLITYIEYHKTDIIVIGYQWIPKDDMIEVLVNFIKVDKGVVINFSESTLSEKLANRLYNSNIKKTIVGGVPRSVYQLASLINDPIINGPFGYVGGKHWGEDVGGTNFLSGLPHNAIVYSRNRLGDTSSDSNRVSAFRHATLGYVWFGDGGFLADKQGNIENFRYPARNDNGIPIAKTGYGDSQTNVYNSLIYANALAWAMEYIQTKKK